MVQKVGASMITADVATFAGMFNNGSVDACYAPAFAFNALELYKGVGKKGGVIQYPLAQMTLQLLIHSTVSLQALVARHANWLPKTLRRVSYRQAC